MESNNKTTAQTLLFPIQEKNYGDDLSFDETVMQYRLDFARWNNDLITGKRIFTEEEIWRTKKNLRTINEIFIRNGYQPIISPFDD